MGQNGRNRRLANPERLEIRELFVIDGVPTLGFPSVGEVQGTSKTGLFIGSGTLIGPRSVLTAGHLAQGEGVHPTDFFIGGDDFKVLDSITYPGYVPGGNNIGDAKNDIAVLQLAEPVVGITPSPIYSGTPAVGTPITFVGFGGTTDAMNPPGVGTKRVGVNVIGAVDDHTFSWTYANLAGGTTYGDSGGPEFIKTGSTYAIVGVTSGIDSVAKTDFATRVDAYSSWLSQGNTTTYVLGTDRNLWQENVGWDYQGRTWIDGNVLSYLVVGSEIYALGTDHNLWEEQAGWQHSGRTLIDSNVKSFTVAVDTLYVEGLDLNLWKENIGWQSNGCTWVDGNVAAYSVASDGIYVMGTDGNLWKENVGWQQNGRTWVDGNVLSFAVGSDSLYVLGTDRNLWQENVGWQTNGRTWVDGNVNSFEATNGVFYVLGTDGKLWRETIGWQQSGRTQIEQSVLAFGTAGAGVIDVLLTDHNLYRDDANGWAWVDGNVLSFAGQWTPAGQSVVMEGFGAVQVGVAAGSAAYVTVGDEGDTGQQVPVDTTAPTLANVPADITIEATGALGAVVNYTVPTASDDQDPNPVVVCDVPSGSMFPIGTTTVTVTASDDAGNSRSTSFQVTVLPLPVNVLATGVLNYTQGVALSEAVATFTDPNGAAPVGNYTATVAWGDGQSSAAMISFDPASGTFTVTAGGHSYQSQGDFNVTVTVTPNGGAPVTVNDSAQVGTAAPPTPTPVPPTPTPAPPNPMPLQTPNQRYVAAVYQDVLGRAPQPGELASWSGRLDAGLALASFVGNLDHSGEYFDTLIEADYQKYLGRAADPQGLASWQSAMQSGMTDEQVEAAFIGSPEYYQHSGGTDVSWVDAMYQNLLGRQPDSAGESYWVNRLANGSNRTEVAHGFAASAEREGQHVTNDYFHYLGRAPDEAGLEYWVNQFTSGAQTNEDLITDIVTAPEYVGEHTS